MQMSLENRTIAVTDARGMIPKKIRVIVVLMKLTVFSLLILGVVYVVEEISFMMISLYTIPITILSRAVLNHMTSKSNTDLLIVYNKPIMILKQQIFLL